MNDGLLEAFHHNAWANRELLAVCRRLSEAQLGATAEGTYGTILGTIQHILESEAGYRSLLSGEHPEWAETVEQMADFDELSRYADDMAAYWEAALRPGFDAERVVKWYSPYRKAHVEAPASVLTTQTLNHGNEHRSQVCTVLTTIGVEPPELDAWSYATATGRIKLEPGPPP